MDSFLSDVRDDLFTKEELISKFTWPNYAVFFLMLMVSISIGVYFWWKGQHSTSEFLMASRSMGTLPMAFSLVASFMSAITLLGTPADIYLSGTQYLVLPFTYPLVMLGTTKIYLPVFDVLNVSTSYEYLGRRFGKPVHLLASTCFVIQMLIYMAIVVYTPALALSQVTGFQVDLACAIIYLVCVFYTSIGGIKAVMWTDTFQAVCMFGSFIAIISKGNYDVGGSAVVFDRNYQSGRVELFNFNPDIRIRHTVWGLLIGGYFTWVSIYGINQTMVQRYLTVGKRSQAVKAIWFNVIGIGGLLLICGYAGLVMYAFYYNCDPLTTKQVDTQDQLFPLFVMQLMGDYPGVPGLFVAGVFSGALSTVSSGLNSLSAVCLKDFAQTGFGLTLSESKATLATKVFSIIFGFLSYGIVFLVKYLPGVLEAALGIFGIVGGPVLGAFSLGMLCPFANSFGAFFGLLSSLLVTMWIGFGQTVSKQYGAYDRSTYSPLQTLSTDGCPPSWLNFTQTPTAALQDFPHFPIYDISYIWFSAIACMWTFLVGAVLSLISPADHRSIDKRFISPAFTSMFFWAPKAWRKKSAQYYEEIGSQFKSVNNGC